MVLGDRTLVIECLRDEYKLFNDAYYMKRYDMTQIDSIITSKEYNLLP